MGDGNVDLNSILPSSFWTDTGDYHGGEQAEYGLSTESTIQQSEQDAKKMTINPMAAPMLMAPLMELGSLDNLLAIMFGQAWRSSDHTLVEDPHVAKVEMAMHQIASQMLDAWSESIGEIADRQRDEEMQQLKTWVDALRAELRMDAIQTDVEKGVVNSAAAREALENSTMNSAMVAAVTVMAVIGLMGAGPAGALAGAESTTMAQAIAALGPAVPQETRAALIFLGAFYSTMAVNAATLMTPIALTSVQGGTNAVDSQMARNYARVLVTVINNPSFDRQVAALLGNVSAEQLNQATAAVKVALLMTSLALLYKTETGGVTQEEVGALLTGQMDLVDQDMGRALTVLIGIYLQQLPADQRVKLVEGILEYIDEVNAEELASPAHILSSIFTDGGSSNTRQRI